MRILDDYGPSVFGFFRPQIILPSWLFDSDCSLQQIVLKHEREHIEARGQLTLLAALTLVAAAPWNIPLWWQLRRLRCAIEIDCDARILRDATSETEYGEALVKVQQHRTRMPIGAIALIEPVTQLERRIRIMMNRKNRGRNSVISICTLVAVSLLSAAGAVNAPDIDALIKPKPEAADLRPVWLDDIIEIIIERYGSRLRRAVLVGRRMPFGRNPASTEMTVNSSL